jgi:hypothetical protein
VKKLFLIHYFFFSLSTNFLSGQNTGNLQLPFPQSDYVEIIGMTSKDIRDINNNDRFKVDGSPYLYDHWSNLAQVYYLEKVYELKTSNYNIYADRFEAKISADSVFVVNPLNVKKIKINDKKFNQYEDPESLKTGYFEELIDFDNYRILRKYNVKIKSSAVNPLTNEKLDNDKIIKYETFYIYNNLNNSLDNIKLKKSTIEPLFKNDNIDMLNKFIKNNRLNYKDINDIIKIVKYYNAL